jgi:hypothetical protein
MPEQSELGRSRRAEQADRTPNSPQVRNPLSHSDNSTAASQATHPSSLSLEPEQLPAPPKQHHITAGVAADITAKFVVATTMTPPTRAGMLAAMNERLRIGLEFDEPTDPIAGTLTVGEAQRPFTGWLGLIAALEAAITDRDTEPNQEQHRGADHDGGGSPR